MNWGGEIAILINVLASAALAGLIGLERELARKPAGLRTHMLVAAAATLYVALGQVLVAGHTEPGSTRADPTRLIEAVVVGVSFLGAGTIFRREGADVVEGLTTGASLLASAALGIGVALGQYVLAAGVTVLILAINRLLGLVEAWLIGRMAEPNRD
jgi:putative Mg2+ transporter-C (MgtC) family protein